MVFYEDEDSLKCQSSNDFTGGKIKHMKSICYIRVPAGF